MPVPIGAFMVQKPVCIEASQPVAEAWRLMRERNSRHLPVLEGGKLVGVLSQRDLLRLESLANIDRSKDPVADAMSGQPYAVPPDEPLELVVTTMAARKLGSAVVVDGGKVVGIFTSTDALQALATLVQRQHQGESSSSLR
jgi:acetoin utilization protein AcuB